MKKIILITFFLTLAGCGDSTPSAGELCTDNDGETNVYCKDSAPILECVNGTYRNLNLNGSTLGTPSPGCTLECSNSNGEATYDEICPSGS